MTHCAIITHHSPHNFGAMLQAHALQFVISEMGHTVEIIDHGLPESTPRLFSKKGIKIDIGDFENCTNQKTGKACRKLPFDVYSPDLNVIVEFDGKQHFQDVPYFFKDKEGYKDQVRRDKLKNDFCKEEGNPKLIRISYMTPFNQISSVLDALLKKAKTSNDKIILASDYPKAGWNA
jgi:very-short-patch-repair endonuclease